MAMDLDTGKGKKKAVRPTMNVTPLVDVVLVLLIIFMVVTPLLTKQMWMNVPPKPDDKEQPPPPPDAVPPIVVTLGTDGEARMNNEVVPRDQLLGRVRGALNARADKVVFFDADSACEYGRALELLDFMKGGGVGTIAVLADALDAPATLEGGATSTGSR